MKNVTFSETKDIEKILLSGEVTQDNVVHVISSMTKYNLSVCGMNDEDNCNSVTRWLKKHYKYYVATELHDVIQQKVKAAHMYGLLESDDLIIYQSELDKITQSGNIRREKVLFVILCVAKLQKNLLGYKNGKYKFALTNIFKLARVHIPSTDRSKFMHDLLQGGFISAPFRVDDEHRYVTFISDDENDKPIIYVGSDDFDELAYVYENWKNDGVGFTRCENCNKLVQQGKTKPRKYCKECAEAIEKENSKERVKQHRAKCNENLTAQN